MSKPNYQYQSFYHRNLPHMHSYDKPIFITWRMAFTLPVSIKQEVEREISEYRKTADLVIQTMPEFSSKLDKKRFAIYDAMLAKHKSLPQTLVEPDISAIVKRAIQHFDQLRYKLISYCIMSNHVHLLLIPQNANNDDKYSLAKIMHSIKRHTAYKINLQLNRNGSFWQREFYDHVIRDDVELARCIYYIINNPVKAGLVEDWKDWQNTYLNAEFLCYLTTD